MIAGAGNLAVKREKQPRALEDPLVLGTEDVRIPTRSAPDIEAALMIGDHLGCHYTILLHKRARNHHGRRGGL